MSSKDVLRKSLESCNVCNVALIETIKERQDTGESVNAICKDLEDFQRQFHGEIYYTASALRDRYNRHGRVARNEQVGGRPTKLQKKREKSPEEQGLELYEQMLKTAKVFRLLIVDWRELGKPMDDEKINNILLHLYEEVRV